MFYDIFFELCKQKKVSRTKACLDCGVSRTAWHKWEDGSTPNGSTINKFASYFGVSVNYLLSAQENTEAVINDISQYQALFAWLLENEDVPDKIKYVIQAELPDDPMNALSALSYKADAHQFDRSTKRLPTPVSKGRQPVNIIKIAGRDGSYKEKHLTDEDLAALATIIDRLPDASGDL